MVGIFTHSRDWLIPGSENSWYMIIAPSLVVALILSKKNVRTPLPWDDAIAGMSLSFCSVVF